MEEERKHMKCAIIAFRQTRDAGFDMIRYPFFVHLGLAYGAGDPSIVLSINGKGWDYHDWDLVSDEDLHRPDAVDILLDKLNNLIRRWIQRDDD